MLSALEENGSVGSTHHAQEAVTAGVAITGMIAFEMIGSTCTTAACQGAFVDIPGCMDVEQAGMSLLVADGFESGGQSAWSGAQPGA